MVFITEIITALPVSEPCKIENIAHSTTVHIVIANIMVKKKSVRCQRKTNGCLNINKIYELIFMTTSPMTGFDVSLRDPKLTKIDDTNP